MPVFCQIYIKSRQNLPFFMGIVINVGISIAVILERYYREPFLTGGAGYIGSHTTIELLNQGHRVVVVDNLSNCSVEALTRIEKIASQTVPYDLTDMCRDAWNLQVKNPEGLQ